MSSRTRKVLGLLLTLAMMLTMMSALVACQPKTGGEGGEGAEGEQPVKGGTLSFYIAEPAAIDPYNGQESEGIQVINMLYDGLVDFDYKTSEIKPAVAESWEPNEDGSMWTFHLKKGTKFHDGTEVKAGDFKYAWERIVDPKNKSQISYHLEVVKGYDELVSGDATGLAGVVAKDDYTLEVTLKYAFADFPYVTGHPSLGPVPKAAVDADPKKFVDMPIGNGPFKMAEPWKHEQLIKTVRFDDYYGDVAYLDGVDYKIFKDENTALAEFKAGNLDVTMMPTGQIQALVQEYGESPDGYTVEPGKQALLGPELSTYYIWLNTKDKTLKNPDLRKAISLAINRQAICDTVLEGTSVPAGGPVPEGIVGYQKDAWPTNKYDVEEAKKYLEKAGYPEGKGLPTLTLSFNTGSVHEEVMLLVQADLEKIGIKSEFDGHEWNEYTSNFTLIEDKEFTNKSGQQLIRMGWLADYPIMDNFLYPLLVASSANNNALYDNPEFDKMLEDARKTTDEDERIKMYQEAEKLAGEDQPLIAVMNYTGRRVGSDRIRDFVMSPMALAEFNKAWIEGGAAAEGASETATGSETATE